MLHALKRPHSLRVADAGRPLLARLYAGCSDPPRPAVDLTKLEQDRQSKTEDEVRATSAQPHGYSRQLSVLRHVIYLYHWKAGARLQPSQYIAFLFYFLFFILFA